MNPGAYGFFLGLAPGLIYFIRNMIETQRVVMAAKALAKQSGEFLDIDFSPSSRINYLMRPKSFIRAGDGPGVRRAKELLLSVRRKMLIRQALGMLIAAIGAPIGVVIAVAIATKL